MAVATDFENTTAKLQAAGIDAIVEPGGEGMRVTITAEHGGIVRECFGQHGQFLRYEFINRTNGLHICAPKA